MIIHRHKIGSPMTGVWVGVAGLHTRVCETIEAIWAVGLR